MEQETTPLRMIDEREYLKAVAEHEPAATREVAEAVGVTRQGADYRLRGLEEEGKVASKMAGNSLIWFLTTEIEDEGENESDDAEPEAAPEPPVERERQESPVEAFDAPRDQSLAEDPPAAQEAHSSPTIDDALIDAVADDVLPGSGAKLDDRREALHATVDYLREHGTATPAELKEAIYPELPGGYASARSWWKNAIYKGLRELADRTDVIAKADTTGEWEYVGDDGNT